MTERPNTIEEWYPDSLAWLRSRYAFLSDHLRDELEGLYATMVAKRASHFNPIRGRAFSYMINVVTQAARVLRRKLQDSEEDAFRRTSVNPWARAQLVDELIKDPERLSGNPSSLNYDVSQLIPRARRTVGRRGGTGR